MKLRLIVWMMLLSLLSPAGALAVETEPADVETVTVTFRDGTDILSSLTLSPGQTPPDAPAARADGSPVLAWVSEGRRITDPESLPVTADTVYAVWDPPVWNRDHVPYATGDGDGRFAPYRFLTRGEAAGMLQALLPGTLPGPCRYDYTDLEEDDPHAGAIRLLSSLGILSGYPDGSFRPEESITRAELTALLTALTPQKAGPVPFSDVAEDHWARAAIATAARLGWVRGYGDGRFCPDSPVTRAESVCMLNAMLGRSAAAAETQALLREKGVWLYADVTPEDWFYGDIMEAAVQHDAVTPQGGERWTALTYRSCGFPAGVHLVGGKLCRVDENRQIAAIVTGQLTYAGRVYCADADGTPLPVGPLVRDDGLYYVGADAALVTGGDIGLLHFGADGRYTSGDETLDAGIEQLLKDSVGEEGPHSREEQLRAVFLYIRDHYTYLSRDHHARGENGWEQESALFMLEKGKGNCYCFTACFMYAARRLGYQAYAVSGGVGRKNDDHAWVMIGDRFFDPELEYAYRYRYETRRYYDLYDKTRAEMPFTYVFPESDES